MTRRFQNLFISSIIVLLPNFLAADATDDFDDASQTYQQSNENDPDDKIEPLPKQLPEKPFTAFTGKVVKNKVRLRLQPSLDSPIIKELPQGEMFIVVGESEDFFAIQPPSGTKAYIFRTYVLDNVVEVNKVNVRLEPNLDSPTIAQLNIGDKIEGTISTQNNKWLEIVPPTTARFFIAKDYVEKIGDASVLAKILKEEMK